MRQPLEWLIAESVRLKAEVVSADEREGGLRRVLNFGHTIGHALEAASGYRRFLHGEAVAWGMIAATHIAAATGRIDKNDAGRISEAVLGLGKLPRSRSSKPGYSPLASRRQENAQWGCAFRAATGDR